MTISKYKQLIWKKYVSPYIRIRDADENGYVNCFTCGKRMYWKEAQAGHWIHGNTKATYFEEKNIHPQCVKCNHFLDGARDIYAVNLEKKYGFGILQELKKKDIPRFVWTIEKLKKVEEEYKNKLKKTCEEKGIKLKNIG